MNVFSDDVGPGSEVAWPRSVTVGVPILGLLFTVAILTVTVFAQTATSSRNVALGLTAIATTAIPWALALWVALTHDQPTGSRFGRFAEIDGAIGVLTVVNFASMVHIVDLGGAVAHQMAVFPALYVAILAVFLKTRRGAVALVLVSYVSIWFALIASARYLDHIDWAGVVAWNLGFLFAITAAFAARLALRAAQRAGRLELEGMANDVRRDVARDVHDVVAHSLAVTMLHITAARMAIDLGSENHAREALVEAERHGRSSMRDIRTIVRVLRGDDDTVASAQPGVRDFEPLVDSFRAAKLPIDYSASGSLDAVTPGVGLVLYRTLQEALTNAARHGKGPVNVDLAVTDDEARLTVVNHVTEPRRDRSNGRHGSGVVGMRERIAAVGGHLDVGQSGAEWILDATFPTAPGVTIGNGSS